MARNSKLSKRLCRTRTSTHTDECIDATNANPFRQKSNDISKDFTYIVSFSLVPLQLVDKITNKIYSQNPVTSSIRLC
ncbi:hypothetical protein TSAR_008891 [Trichomalopsis sarcophagae]|uniref:Uncharacterized protein n=1 Tax=Trichomalopsis sarcophagae TaxID=543379 RepID=A0A232F4H7_9HYME|nr:hypothetical protein TSAR_008891 [Trichomalopsis sarcophagae]